MHSTVIAAFFGAGLGTAAPRVPAGQQQPAHSPSPHPEPLDHPEGLHHAPPHHFRHGRNFERFGYLIFENTDYDSVVNMPTWQEIANLKNNRLLSNFFAVEHPSLPNYLAGVAGTTFGVMDDDSPSHYNFTGPTIIDLLEAGGISWKFYAEDYPGVCFTGAANGIPHSYAAKHVPAVYFQSVTTNPERCANIVPATDFQKDFEAGTLPQWFYYTPNLENDGHDSTVQVQSAYLQKEWLPRFKNPEFTQGLAMVMSYDEREQYGKPNQVWSALIGDVVKPEVGNKHDDDTMYNHYSLMSTVEDNWHLGSLGRNDTVAPIISFKPNP